MGKQGGIGAVDRTMELLQLLYQGNSICVEDIAESFGVDIRTAYRDLNRLGGILEDAGEGQKKLATHLKGQCSVNDLVNVLNKTGSGKLFPITEKMKITQLLLDKRNNSCIVRNMNYEESPLVNHNFTCLNDLIDSHYICSFQYKGSIRCVAPHKLVNNKGIWYLAATESGVLKSFHLGKIQSLQNLHEKFTLDMDIVNKINAEEGIWFSDDKIEILIHISGDACQYFKRRKLFPEQEIVKEMDSGELLITCRVVSQKQLFPLVRYWLPNIRIHAPADWQQELIKQFIGYVSGYYYDCSSDR